MNALTNNPPSLPHAKRTLNDLSPGLKSLLVEAAETEHAVHAIATLPAMLDEARAALPALKVVATHPAGDEGVKRVVGRRFAVFTQPDRSDAEWAMWWADYVAVLADVPECALEAGMQAWLRDPKNEFLPKPGQLRALAMNAVNPQTRAYQRAKAAIEYVPPKVYEQHEVSVAPRIIRKEPTSADRERVKRWAADFGAQVKPPTTATFPESHGATDERGLTAEMRELMARR